MINKLKIGQSMIIADDQEISKLNHQLQKHHEALKEGKVSPKEMKHHEDQIRKLQKKISVLKRFEQ